MIKLSVTNEQARCGVVTINNGGIRDCNMVRFLDSTHRPNGVDLLRNEFLAFEFNTNTSPNFYVPLIGKYCTSFYTHQFNARNCYRPGVGIRGNYNLLNVTVRLVKIIINYVDGQEKSLINTVPYEGDWQADFEFYHVDINYKNTELLFVQHDRRIHINHKNIGFTLFYPQNNNIRVSNDETTQDLIYEQELIITDYHSSYANFTISDPDALVMVYLKRY